jgi:hypothetical protein
MPMLTDQEKQDLETRINENAVKICPVRVIDSPDLPPDRCRMSAEEQIIFVKIERDLYLYCSNVHFCSPKYKGKNKGILFNVEILGIIRKCLKKFEPEQGNPFMNYFNKSIKTMLPKPERMRILWEEKKGTIKMPARTIKAIGKMEKCIEFMIKSGTLSSDYKSLSPKQIAFIKGSTGLSERTINETLSHLNGTSTVRFDDAVNIVKSDENVTRTKKDDYLKTIEEVFNEYNDETKPYLSKLITAEHHQNLKGCSYSFVDNEIIDNYDKTGEVPTLRSIALGFGKGKDPKSANADATMRLKRFFEKVKRRLIEQNIVSIDDFSKYG